MINNNEWVQRERGLMRAAAAHRGAEGKGVRNLTMGTSMVRGRS